MGRYVVKLGSNIVADDGGALREDVMRSVCATIAERHRAGDDFVVVSSGAIARGMEAMGLSERPASMADLQAASAVGQGRLYRVWDEMLSGEAVLKGRSPFGGRIGEQVAASSITLVDDATDPRAPAASDTDGEGLACRIVPLLGRGVLEGFLHNAYTGRASGTVSTGSAKPIPALLPLGL